MTREIVNRIFGTELGLIYVTSDDYPFIRHEEALQHVEAMQVSNPDFDDTITDWYPED